MERIVVAYDISSDARRVRLSRFLEGFGLRVQYSVFECVLGAHALKRLLREAPRLLEEGDGLRVYRLGSDPKQVIVIAGRPSVEWPSIIVA